MWKTLVRRLLIMIPQLLILSLIVFILASFMPGDALTGKIDSKNSPARIEELRRQYGFYDPWNVKFVRWLGNALHGDLGQSLQFKMPTVDIIKMRAINTFWLSLLTLFLQYLIAVPLGILAGRYHDKFPDKVINFYTYISLSMPTIILGLFFIFVFAFRLHWFPNAGSVSSTVMPGTVGYYLSYLHHMILPALTGALLSTVGIIQYLRNDIVDFENSDFVLTAKSKGVPVKKIYTRHILRNAILPVASFTGYNIVGILTGSVFIESVFSYPGMGQLYILSILQRDYSVVNATIIFFAFLTVVGTLLSDIIMSIVDPRIQIK